MAEFTFGFDDPSRFAHSPYYNDSHFAWREQLRKFVDTEIMPYAAEWDEAGAIPDELRKKASEFGLLRMGYPEEYGGISEGLDRFHSIITTEELSRPGTGGLASSLMIHGIGLPPIIAIGSEEMKQRIAPEVLAGDKVIALGITEPSGGSDVANIHTKCVRDGDHYVINGQKTLISSGMRADYVTLAVRTGGPGLGGISLILVETDREGFSRTSLKKMGWWMSDTATLHFDDVRVPVDNLIGGENQGFMGIMYNFNGERLGMAAGANAFARICYEDALAWARERQTFGKRLADHQVIRHKFAEMARHINTTQAYLERCTWQVQCGETPVADLALLKVQATTTMEYCAREAMQILGGAGFIRGNRIERIYREVRVNAIGGGSEEIMRDLAARQMNV